MKFTKIFLFSLLAIFSLSFVYSKVLATSGTGSVTVTVIQPPTATLTADSTLVDYNTTTTLRVSSTGTVSSCTVTWTGGSNTSGSSFSFPTSALTTATTYSLVCSGAGGDSTPSVVTVNVKPQPSCSDGLKNQDETGVDTGGICVTGSLTISPSACTITAGSSTCSVSGATWTTTKATSPALIDTNTNTTLSTLANNATALKVWVAYPQTVFNLNDGAKTLSSKTATALCASGSSWNGSTCALIVETCSDNLKNQDETGIDTGGICASGTLTVSPATCTIASGASSCSVTGATWTTAKATSPVLINKDTNSTISSLANNATAIKIDVAYPQTVFNLNDGVKTLSSKTATASCITGTSWDGVKCAPVVATCSDGIKNQDETGVDLGGSCASGTLTVSPTSCVIASGASTCTVTGAIWTTSKVSSPELVDTNTNTTLSTLANNATALKVWVAYPQTVFNLNDGAKTLSSKTATALCASGSSWNGSTCALIVETCSDNLKNQDETGIDTGGICASGTLTVSPATCTIASGASSCSVTGATWTTSKVTSTTLVDTNTNTVLSSSTNNATALKVWVSYPQTVFNLNDGAKTLSSKTATASCIAGTSWSGTKCDPIIPPTETCSDGIKNQDETGIDTGGTCASGTLTVSPTSCVIASGASTCTVTGAKWTTSKATSPALVDGNTGLTLSTLANNATALKVWVGYPQTVFNLKDGAKILASSSATTVTSSCIAGTTWDGSVCAPSAETCSDGIKNQDETGIDTGGTCASGTLTVSPTSCVIASGASTCTVTGAKWTTSKATSPALVDGNTGLTLSTLANNATALKVWVGYPQTVFNLKDGAKILASSSATTVTSSCIAGTTWDGSVCAPSAETCSDGIKNQDETGIDTGGTCASGTLTVSPTSCVIASGASTCTVTGAKWTTSKATSPALVDGNTGLTLSTLANNATALKVWVGYPQTVFNLKDGAKILASSSATTVTSSCIAGTTWDGSVCAPSAETCSDGIKNQDETGIDTGGTCASGTLTVSPTSCVIASGASTCTVTGAKWTTSKATSPALVDGNTGLTLSTLANNATALKVWVGYPQTVFNLKDGAKILASSSATTVTSSCIAGTTWDGSVCAPSASSGNLTILPSSCIINLDSSTCTVTGATWTTINATSPALVDGNTGATLSTLANNNVTPLEVWVGYPQTVFDLKDGTSNLDTVTISSSCKSGTTWNGSSCSKVGVCENGAVNFPDCTLTSGGSCVNGAVPPLCIINSDGTCNNGATNPEGGCTNLVAKDGYWTDWFPTPQGCSGSFTQRSDYIKAINGGIDDPAGLANGTKTQTITYNECPVITSSDATLNGKTISSSVKIPYNSKIKLEWTTNQYATKGCECNSTDLNGKETYCGNLSPITTPALKRDTKYVITCKGAYDLTDTKIINVSVDKINANYIEQ